MKISSLAKIFFKKKRNGRFKVHFPAMAEDVNKYYAVLENLFGIELIPKASFLHSVPDINPFGLIIMTNTVGILQGGIELYSFVDDFFDKYLMGSVSDPDFMTEFLLDTDETLKSGRLYCAITTNQSYLKSLPGREYIRLTREIRDHLLVITAKAIKEAYFNEISTIDSLSIYAIEASDYGKALLQRIGFRKISDGSERKDKTPLYRLDLYPGNVDAILAHTLNPPTRSNRNTLAKFPDLEVTRNEMKMLSPLRA